MLRPQSVGDEMGGLLKPWHILVAEFLGIVILCSAQHPDTATVYFYRYKVGKGAPLKAQIYCDNHQLGALANGRYLKVQIPVGKHLFRLADDKESGAIVNLEVGQTYFFRADVYDTTWKRRFRLDEIMADQGSFDITKLKPEPLPAAYPPA